MKNEIGSEFWDVSPSLYDKVFLLSGRGALEYIIQDIINNHKIESVLLPSYCCHTMIEPFFRHNIDVRFYDVYYEPKLGMCVDIPEFKDNEIFYYMTYFGFSELHGLDFEKIRNKYEVIIEDRTHSWQTGQPSFGDYIYVSCRKWAGFYGIAVAEKIKGYFNRLPEKKNDRYCKLRKKAMKMKEAYICTGHGDKQDFLSVYDEAEKLLELDYVGYSAPEECYKQLAEFDFETLRHIRKRNADVLIRELSKIDEIQLIYSERKDWDTPLFVPILLKKRRDELRSWLIENRVYCPVHWPLSDYHDSVSMRGKLLYQNELSLVCDQRYNSDDMLSVAQLIKDFFK